VTDAPIIGPCSWHGRGTGRSPSSSTFGLFVPNHGRGCRKRALSTQEERWGTLRIAEEWSCCCTLLLHSGKANRGDHGPRCVVGVEVSRDWWAISWTGFAFNWIKVGLIPTNRPRIAGRGSVRRATSVATFQGTSFVLGQSATDPVVVVVEIDQLCAHSHPHVIAGMVAEF